MSTEALHGEAVSLVSIVASDPTTALYLPLAERLLARGEVAEAIRLCEERRTRPGRGVGDHIVLGRCYLADGRIAEARAEFQGALDLDRENVIALKSLAGILSHDGKHADAADLYRAVCRVDPGDLESQTALHQISSGEYPEVRPAEVIVDDSGVTWQPIRPEREEDHLPELALGLRTLDARDAEALRPAAPRAATPASAPPPAPAEAAPRGAEAAAAGETSREPFLRPEEIEVGATFPSPAETRTPPRPVPTRPAVQNPFEDRLDGLDVEAFQESALERLEEALRPIEARPLGEVEPASPAPATAPAASATTQEPAAPAAADAPAPRVPSPAPTRSAIWEAEPQPAPSSNAAPPPGASPAPAPAPVAPAPEAGAGESVSRVKGNRSAFEQWLRSVGGGGGA